MTVDHRRQVAPLRQQSIPAHVRRPGIVYGINIFDPDTSQVATDYVGQTFQKLWQREAQHRADQPFSDLIVGDPFVIEQGVWTCDEIDAREKFHIHQLQPRFNYEHNLDNLRRIPVFEARQQRQQRDAQRARDGVVGIPVWIHPDQRDRREASGSQRWVCPPWLRGFARWVGRLLWRWAKRAGSRVALPVLAWLLVAAAVWLLHPASVPAGTGARDGAVVASAGLVVAFVAKAKKPRRRRRRRR